MKPRGTTTTATISRSAAWRTYAAGAAVCAATSFGAYALGVRPAVERHAQERQKTGELLDRRRKASTTAAALEASRRRLVDARAALATLPLHLEPAFQVNQRLARLTDLANNNGLAIDLIRTSDPVAAPDYRTVPIVIAGTGSYPACAAFLRDLRRTFPDTAVKSFDTTRTGGGPADATASFQVDLSWHTAK